MNMQVRSRKAQALQADNTPWFVCGESGTAWKAKERNSIVSKTAFYSQGIAVGTRAYQLRHRSTLHALNTVKIA
jgi:hypothetical protein